MHESIYILRLKGRLTASQEKHLRKSLIEQMGTEQVIVLADDMRLEVFGDTYHKATDSLPPFGHPVLIWTGDAWDIAYREERGDTWRWLFIEQEHIDYPVDYWVYLPHPPPIEIVLSSTSGKTMYQAPRDFPPYTASV